MPATQVKFNTPNTDFAVVDNGTPFSFPTLSAGTHIGYGTIPPPGQTTQASNPFSDTGSTTLDTVNDQSYQDPSIGTYVGNPVSGVVPVTKTVSTILNDGRQALRLLFKNPAIIFF
jgi:hypothetical protein